MTLNQFPATRVRKVDPDNLLPGIHPVLARIYAGRHVTQAEDLNTDFQSLLPWDKLSGIYTAVELLVQALTLHQHVLIVADFDADGATSCALMVNALRQFGLETVSYLVPNRFTFGYGLTPEIVAIAYEQKPDLLITVDNGISSIEGVAAAKEYGMKVIITDHHLPGATLPAADAIVNPNQAGDPFPSKAIAGVGVSFYLMLALRARLREMGYFQQQNRPEPNMAQFLDLVALGTVADVVPLDRNNRILVAQGIKRIRAGYSRVGIQALLKVGRRQAALVVASDLGFAVAPRLNAAGRLTDMSVGIECLLAEDSAKATKLAAQLDQLNLDRRQIEADMKLQAFDQVVNNVARSSSGLAPPGICLFDAQWHQGVIGVLAGRLKEHYHRPTVIFAQADEATLKGSARSIAGLNIRDLFDLMATRHPGLIHRFGGHAMAAGLTLAKKDFDEFRRVFVATVQQQLNPEDLEQVIKTDGALGIDDLSLEMAELLQQAGPWGQEFPEPAFEGEFLISDVRIVGERHARLVLMPYGFASVPRTVAAIAFNQGEVALRLARQSVRCVYRLCVNDFNNQRTAQLVIEHLWGQRAINSNIHDCL